jgi:hypothetical protein
MFDPKCRRLAESFLEELPLDDPRIDHLAQDIQDTIEDFLAEDYARLSPLRDVGTMSAGLFGWFRGKP